MRLVGPEVAFSTGIFGIFTNLCSENITFSKLTKRSKLLVRLM
jgi:hypothetical protein